MTRVRRVPAPRPRTAPIVDSSRSREIQALRPLDGTLTARSARLSSARALCLVALGSLVPVGASASLETGITAHRTGCYAPCGVHFDAFTPTNDTTRGEGEEFLELLYEWDFGDPKSGAWQTSALDPALNPNSMNREGGPVVAHVFDPKRWGDSYGPPCASKANVSCRTYKVTVDVVTPEGLTDSDTVTIDVWDPDDGDGLTTTCYSTNANFTGCPAGATQTTSSDFDAAVNGAPDNSQLLFHAGQTFLADARLSIKNSVGTTIRIGRFGSGTDPVVDDNYTPLPTGHLLDFEDAQDAVIQQLRFAGPNYKGADAGTKFSQSGFSTTGRHNMLYRLDIDAYNEFLNWGASGDSGLQTNVFIVEVDTTGEVDPSANTVNHEYGSYVNMMDGGILGNVLVGNESLPTQDSAHALRLMASYRMAIGHNHFKNAGVSGGGGKAALNVRCQAANIGPMSQIPPGDRICRYAHVYHNRLSSSFGYMGITHNGGQDNCERQRYQYILIESNFLDLDGATATSTIYGIDAGFDHVVVRNNACYMHDYPFNANAQCVRIGNPRGCSDSTGIGMCRHCRAYNNAAWRTVDNSQTEIPHSLVEIDPITAFDNRCDNNLHYVPGLRGFFSLCRTENIPAVDVPEPGGFITTGPNPFSSAGPPDYIDDFRLNATSAAIDVGTTYDEVPTDAGGSCRLGSAEPTDAGAWEESARPSACLSNVPSRPAAPVLLDLE